MVPSEHSESEYSEYSCSQDSITTDISDVEDDQDDSRPEPNYAQDMDEYLLFVYGTLMSPKLWRKVTGLAAHPIHTKKAVLHNHVALKVENEAYPGLIPRENKKVVGQVLSIKSKELMEKIDRYEQDFYTKTLVKIEIIGDDDKQEQQVEFRADDAVCGDDKTLSNGNNNETTRPPKRLSSDSIESPTKRPKSTLEVGVYLWNNKLDLEETEWDYNVFVEYYQDGYLAEL